MTNYDVIRVTIFEPFLILPYFTTLFNSIVKHNGKLRIIRI